MIRQATHFSLQTKLITCIAFILTMPFLPLTAQASGKIGMVKTYQPEASVTRQGVEIKLALGSEIFEGDVLKTDSDGMVGIIFSDGAVLTLGPSGKLVVEEFLFLPDEKKVSFLSHVMSGTVAFVSGAIGRISPGAVQFTTPTATLGLRGTKILIRVD